MCLFNHKTLPESLQFYCKMFFQAWTLLKIHNHTNTGVHSAWPTWNMWLDFRFISFLNGSAARQLVCQYQHEGGRDTLCWWLWLFFPSAKGCDWHETLVWHLSITGMSDLNIRTLYKKKSISDSTIFFCMGYLCFPFFVFFYEQATSTQKKRQVHELRTRFLDCEPHVPHKFYKFNTVRDTTGSHPDVPSSLWATRKHLSTGPSGWLKKRNREACTRK